MKLRVRSSDGGPTYKIQVSEPETLDNLKQAVSAALSLPPESLRLSLNKRDAIDAPGSTTLSSLEVRGGDLLYYSVGTDSRVPGSATEATAQQEEHKNRLSVGSSPASSGQEIDGASGTVTSVNRDATPRVEPKSMRTLCAEAAVLRAAASRNAAAETGAVLAKDVAALDKGKLPMPRDAEDMAVESRLSEEILQDDDDGPLATQGGDEKLHSSVPALLQRVLIAESDFVRERPAYLILAAHAVMLETGFVRVRPRNNSSSLFEEKPILESWARNGGIVNVLYSVPELLEVREANTTTQSVGDVLLRCQIVGNAFIAYGTVAGSGRSQVCRLSLPVWKFLCQPEKDTGCLPEEVKPAQVDTGDGQIGPKHQRNDTFSVFQNVFDLWKEVKDRLSLPLLADLCEKAGLPPPPSLLLLPTELKMKILEPLPPATLAAVACVCSELKFLSSSDELWKEKFQWEFRLSDIGDRAPGGRGWKVAFGREWVRRKRRQEDRRIAERHYCSETLVLRPPSGPHPFGGDFPGFPGFPGGPAFPFPGRFGPGSGGRYRRGLFPAPGVGSNRGPLASRLGGDVWADFGQFGARGDDAGDDVTRY